MNKLNKSVYLFEDNRVVTIEGEFGPKEIMLGTLRIRKEYPANSPWKDYPVRCSNKVKTWIENNWIRMSRRPTVNYLVFGQLYVGTKFVSMNASKKAHDCPFRIDMYTPEPGSDIPINYKLNFVDEDSPNSFTETDAFDREEKRLVNKRLHKSQWVRVKHYTTNGDFKDLPQSLRNSIAVSIK